MKQAIATATILLFAGAADGIMDAFGTVKFLLIGAAVMAVAYIPVRGEADAVQPD